MEKFLITGFSGFVSYHFLQYLDSISNESEKIQVLGLDIAPPLDFNSPEYKFKSIEVNFLSINLLDFSSLEKALISFIPDYILHLASLSSVGDSWKRPVECFMNNTNIFLNLVESVRINNLKCRILSIGSSEEYGIIDPHTLPLKETTSLNPISPYAIARVSQEMISKCYVNSYNSDIILTRSFNHIGTRQRDIFVIPSFIKQIVQGKIDSKEVISIKTGDLSITRDFLDVRDVVRAYYLLIKKGKNGELYNVCTGTGRTLNEILTLISIILDVNVDIIQDNSLIRPNDNSIIIGDNSKIKEAINWYPEYSLEKSLQDIIQYWFNQLTKKGI